ncbi:hypothetical protein D3C76_1409180 [compost metagenome]
MAQPLDVDPLALSHIHAIEQDLSGADLREAQDGPTQGALATARLTHQPKHLPGGQTQRHTIDGFHPLPVDPERTPARGGEAHLQIFHVQQGHDEAPTGSG